MQADSQRVFPRPPAMQRDCSAFDLTEPTSYTDMQQNDMPVDAPLTLYSPPPPPPTAKLRHKLVSDLITASTGRARANSSASPSPSPHQDASANSTACSIISTDIISGSAFSAMTDCDSVADESCLRSQLPNPLQLQSLGESCIISGSPSMHGGLRACSLAESGTWTATPSFASLDSHVLHSSASMSVTNSVSADHTGDGTPSTDSVELPQQQQELTDRAVAVVQRVLDKLTGLDFHDSSSSASHKPLAISEQIDRLINEATSNDNLSTCYMGWCPLW